MHYQSVYDIEWKYYDLLYGDFREDINFYKNVIKGGDVLELMCGTGRISQELSKFSNPFCLDIDERMLKIAKNKGLNCIKADVRDFKINKKFDFVIIPLNSLLLFNTIEKVKILKNSEEHLKDNGKIIVDILPPLNFEESMVYLGDHKIKENLEIWRFFVPNYSEDMRELYLTYFYDIFENGNYRRDSAVLTLYMENFEDMKKIVRMAKLKILKVYGNYAMDDFYPETSEKMIFIMERL